MYMVVPIIVDYFSVGCPCSNACRGTSAVRREIQDTCSLALEIQPCLSQSSALQRQCACTRPVFFPYVVGPPRVQCRDATHTRSYMTTINPPRQIQENPNRLTVSPFTPRRTDIVKPATPLTLFPLQGCKIDFIVPSVGFPLKCRVHFRRGQNTFEDSPEKVTKEIMTLVLSSTVHECFCKDAAIRVGSCCAGVVAHTMSCTVKGN